MMIKKKIKYICFVAIMLFCCVFIASCGKPEEEDNNKASLVIVAGIHSNSQIMSWYSKLSTEIEEIFSDFGNVRIIVVDKNPDIALGTNEKPIGYFNELFLKESQENKEKNKLLWQKNYLNEQMKLFKKECEKLAPDDPEVDTLGAIFKAVDVLNSISSYSDNKKIIIYDTGLCTSGKLNFTDSEWADLLFCNENLDERIQAKVDSLKSEKWLPNLSGIKVTWYGIGQTAEPQEQLSRPQIENLKQIWSTLLNSAGAIPSENEEYFFSIESYDGTNYPQSVTTIPIPTEESDHKQSDNGNSGNGPTKVSEERLGFKRNSSEFVSKKKAMNTLKPLANDMLSTNENFLLVGTTADPNREGGSIPLSEERAKKVKECLVDLGVPENRLQILGWGAKPPLYNENEWESGGFNENIAKENRSVLIMSLDSEKAQELLNKGHP